MSNPASHGPAAIIIPVHNRMRFTLACLDRLRWTAGESGWKTIIVDDGSTDGTGAAVRHLHPGVEVVDGNGELYWTGAMVKGMQRAMELGASEIVWLNDDTHPDEASLRRIVGLVRQDPRNLISSCAWTEEKPVATCSLRRRPVLPAPGALAPADVLAGFQLAFSVQVVAAIGFPDPKRWPHYAGDSGFTRAAHDAGFHLLVDGGSRIDLCDHPDTIEVGEVFWRGEESLSARIRRTFLGKNSRYRLSSRWHLDCLYRGLPCAALVFPARCGMWLGKILLHRGKRSRAWMSSSLSSSSKVHSARSH